MTNDEAKRLEEIIRKSERERCAAWIRQQREDDTDRPRVQVYDVLADGVIACEHWRKR